MVSIDEVMVSFDVTSMYTNIPVIETLKIIKDYVNNDHQFTRKTATTQDKFFDLHSLVLTTTWYTFNSKFTNNLMALQWENQGHQPQQKFICRLMKKLQYQNTATFNVFRSANIIRLHHFIQLTVPDILHITYWE